jgi:DNA polymerase-4
MRFTPKLQMASIDEAYLDMSGTERLLGPPLRAAHALHDAMQESTKLNCSIGIATSRLVAKVASDLAKPNGVLWVNPGQEAAFLAPLAIRKIPGVGKVMEKSLRDLGVTRVGDLANLDSSFLEECFGKWGVALAGKAQGLDAGGWYDEEIGAELTPKSISHEHTFGNDTADRDRLESMLVRLSQMVARRLRESGFHARTIRLKLRYADFSTITRAHALIPPTQLDQDILVAVLKLFRRCWRSGTTVRLLGVQASCLERAQRQIELLQSEVDRRWERALAAADRLRDKYGEAAISLASAVKSEFRERTHDNPATLRGKTRQPENSSSPESPGKSQH